MKCSATVQNLSYLLINIIPAWVFASYCALVFCPGICGLYPASAGRRLCCRTISLCRLSSGEQYTIIEIKNTGRVTYDRSPPPHPFPACIRNPFQIRSGLSNLKVDCFSPTLREPLPHVKGMEKEKSEAIIKRFMIPTRLIMKTRLWCS
jgi:hypothetical protein